MVPAGIELLLGGLGHLALAGLAVAADRRGQGRLVLQRIVDELPFVIAHLLAVGRLPGRGAHVEQARGAALRGELVDHAEIDRPAVAGAALDLDHHAPLGRRNAAALLRRFEADVINAAVRHECDSIGASRCGEDDRQNERAKNQAAQRHCCMLHQVTRFVGCPRWKSSMCLTVCLQHSSMAS